ncbi:fibrobacter succinogenes major paralogous domain-containing protein [Fibrobacter sp. UBA2449]|uniref:fibrobacter succinogenes major paralogous domain-containing protein n=1 Tax=Fibrobacter sp. UBA2449 TaxID=1946529 RepID=UPI0025BA4C0A|nr:fibrobacter succinogenes major paralogous domain-containing protein [Fibrobacter sp. UBA2449]
MALKKFLMVSFVAAVLVACGDDDSSFATRPSDGSSSSVTPKSSDSETSVSSSSTKPSSSSVESSSSDGYVEPSTVVAGTMTDERDGKTYKTVTIGTQTWMAENLNYAYIGIPYNYSGYTFDSTSWCYGDNPANCTKYGRLYTWAAAMDSVGTWSTNSKGCGYGTTCSPTYPVRGICPEGWHLPTKAEFETLFTAVGGSSTAGKMLKSTNGWNSSGNGTDAYAFSALPAGRRNYDGDFNYEGDRAYFWSSTEGDSSGANGMCLDYYSDSAGPGNYYKYYEFSVRCLKDVQAD